MFNDRKDAGVQLAKKLISYSNKKDVVVLAIPRGGVPVAYEISSALNLPLNVLLVRKLGIPENEETAMGAIAIEANGSCQIFLDEEVIRHLQISKEKVQIVINKEQKELEHRSKIYHKDRPAINLQKKTIILVDDGIATGSTMQVAINAIKKQQVEKIIVAVPVSSLHAYNQISCQVDEIISLVIPKNFNAVGLWYINFPQVSHEEVKELLTKSNKLWFKE